MTSTKKDFKYLYLQERMEGGVMCEEIDLVPEKKDAQFFKIKMLINKKTKIFKAGRCSIREVIVINTVLQVYP